MMGHRERLKSGDEYDALTRWRKVLAFRAGARRLIKRKVNKRHRRDIKKLVTTTIGVCNE
jgi:hypothetical protein